MQVDSWLEISPCREVEADEGPAAGLTVLLTGRGAKNPSSLQIAPGVEEATCLDLV